MKAEAGDKSGIDIRSDVMKIYNHSSGADIEYSLKELDAYYLSIRTKAQREDCIDRLSQIDMQLYKTNLEYMFSAIGAWGFYIAIKNAVRSYNAHETLPFLVFAGVCTFIVVLAFKFTIFNIKNYSEISTKNKLARSEKERLIEIIQEFDREKQA